MNLKVSHSQEILLRSEVFIALKTLIVVFEVVKLYNLVGVDQFFRCFHSTKTLVSTYKTTWCHNTEDNNPEDIFK